MSLFDDLMLGVGVIVDDQVFSEEGADGIVKIKANLEAKNIPLALFEMPPETETVKHFGHVNFVILDWDFFGGSGGVNLSASGNDARIDFLRDLRAVCFTPVFILSHLTEDEIKRVLIDNGLYEQAKTGTNWIFVHDKAALVGHDGSKLFATIEKWLEQTVSIYVLKIWQREVSRATRDLCWDFQNADAGWPAIFWKSYEDDKSDPPSEMADLLMRNLQSRMGRCAFDRRVVAEGRPDAAPESVRRVIEAERFVPQDRLAADIAYTGDLYKEVRDGAEKYYLNIRAQCDLLRKKEKDRECYCLKGAVLDPASVDCYHSDIEQFQDKPSAATVAGVYGGKILRFNFVDLKIRPWLEMKPFRVGRLLPPFITNIQQRYAHFMHRQGIPRTPASMIAAVQPKAKESQIPDVPTAGESPQSPPG